MTKGDPQGLTRRANGEVRPVGRAATTLIAMALAVALALSACNGKTPTGGLELFITTCDLRVGTDFDAIQAVVSQGTSTQTDPWQQRFDASQAVPQPIELPTTLVIRAGTNPDQDALIEVTALLSGMPVVQRVFQTKVPTDRVDTRWIFLAADCRGKTCTSAETCEPQTATCVPIGMPPGDVPDMCKFPDDGGSGASTGAGSGGTSGSGAGSGAGSGSTSGTGSGAGTGTTSGSSTGTTGMSGSSSPEAGVDAGPRPNCVPGGPGLTNCGLSHQDSCCTSLEVPGGTFYRTFDATFDLNGNVILAADGGPAGEADPATVSPFKLDKYVVTVGRFRQFVNAWKGGWLPDAGSGKQTQVNGGQGLANENVPGAYEPGWGASDDSNVGPTDANLVSCDQTPTDALLPKYATWTPSAGTQENLPINCVTWAEAYAFCIWDGGFLPSDAEWGYAAAGGSEQREYPWGPGTPGTACPGTGCWYAIQNCAYPNGSGVCTGIANIAPVGTASLGAGLWGQLDLVGDVFEWILDWHGNYVSPCTDCADLAPTPARLIRGGCFSYDTTYLLPSSQYEDADPATRAYALGLRCARAP
jgi:sulfatase modifying factor 1